MANGTIALEKSGSGSLAGRILWSSTSKGTNENASVVTAQLQICKPNGYTTMGTWTGSLTVGAKTVSISYYSHVGSEWVSVATVETTVGHNADGSGTCYLYGKISGPGGTTVEGTIVSGSQTVTLDTIDRYAYLVSAPDFNDEQNPTITYKNPLGSSVTKLEACISLDGESVDVKYKEVGKTDTSFQFSLSESERNVLRSATVGANSRYVTFKLRTTIGDKKVFSTLRRTFSIKDPNPIISPSVEDVNSTTVALTGNKNSIIRFHSRASVTIGASAVKQASLTSKKVTCGGKSLTADGTLNAVESDSFVFTATDNRGNTTVKTVTVPFVPYIRLTCSLANSLPDASGHMTVQASGNYYNGSFGSKSNSLKAYCRYKPHGGTYSGWTAMTVSLSGNSYTAAAEINGLDYQTAYVFQTYAADALDTAYSVERTVKATPVFDWGESDFSFHVPVNFHGKTFKNAYQLLTSADDLNERMDNGWYCWSYMDKPANAPGTSGTTYMCVMRVSGSGAACVQELFDASDSNYANTAMRRVIYDSTAYGWEWVNPPMAAGVEYRTLQRHDGAPVYTMLVSCGALPNKGTKTVSHPFSASHVIAWDGVLYSSTESQNLTGNTNTSIMVTKTAALVTTTRDLSSYNFHMIYRYTK